MQERDKFLGRGWSFPPTFSKSRLGTGAVDMVEAQEDIDQSLRILLSTSLGERMMRPDYGCNLTDFQFEAINATLVGFIRDMVSNALLYHEPRIRVDHIDVTQPIGQAAWEGRLVIDVHYTIRTTNARFNFVYDFYVYEANGR